MRVIVGVLLVLAACSSSRDAGDDDGSTTSAQTEVTDSTTESTPAASTPSTGGSTSTSTTTSTTVSGTPGTVTGSAIAGALGGVEAAGPPFAQTDPFSEAVRLSDGTCVGWAESKGGSTAGLAVGAPVTILDAVVNQEIGSGEVSASRWVDMADGGEQWNCVFDFTATVTGTPAEFRVRIANLEPWLARPDPSAPGTFVASVSTGVSIGQIPSCPPVPPEPTPTTTTAGATTTTARPTTTTTTTTTTPRPPVTGWDAVGQYWSRGVDALCSAGLPVTAVARPCRPSGVGSEYIASVVDSDDPTTIYANGTEIPAGTQLTVVVPIARLCG
jgi:hypothetical protein